MLLRLHICEIVMNHALHSELLLKFNITHNQNNSIVSKWFQELYEARYGFSVVVFVVVVQKPSI